MKINAKSPAFQRAMRVYQCHASPGARALAGAISAFDEAIWQTMETAPTDGTPVLLYCTEWPEFGGDYRPPGAASFVVVGWYGEQSQTRQSDEKRWVWCSNVATAETGPELDGAWIHFSWAACDPIYWRPLPVPPRSVISAASISDAGPE